MLTKSLLSPKFEGELEEAVRPYLMESSLRKYLIKKKVKPNKIELVLGSGDNPSFDEPIIQGVNDLAQQLGCEVNVKFAYDDPKKSRSLLEDALTSQYPVIYYPTDALENRWLSRSAGEDGMRFCAIHRTDEVSEYISYVRTDDDILGIGAVKNFRTTVEGCEVFGFRGPKQFSHTSTRGDLMYEHFKKIGYHPQDMGYYGYDAISGRKAGLDIIREGGFERGDILYVPNDLAGIECVRVLVSFGLAPSAIASIDGKSHLYKEIVPDALVTSPSINARMLGLNAATNAIAGWNGLLKNEPKRIDFYPPEMI